MGSGLLQLDLDRIRPSTNQPRRDFDPRTLDELAASFRTEGVLQPVIVRPLADGSYELIAGERRWRAAQLAGLLKIPALVRDVQEERALELALIENIQREELNPVDAAAAFRTLIDDMGLTHEEVADRVGKQRTTVSNMLRLLELPGPVKQKVREGTVSAGHAKALGALASPQLQIRLADRIARDGLSVRDAERLVKRMHAGGRLTAAKPAVPRDANVVDAEQALQSALGTKVSITEGKKGGRIELFFYSPDELRRVYEILLQVAQKRRQTASPT